MPTPIDDLKVGQWVAVTVTENESGGDMLNPFSLFRSMHRGVPVDGRPLQIQAISLPFICVSDGVNRMALDIRTVEVQLLKKSYVKLLRQNTQRQAHYGRSGSVAEWAVPDVQEVKKEDNKRNDRCCPLCGEWLVERLINETSNWVLACRRCGFTGTIPRDGEET